MTQEQYFQNLTAPKGKIDIVLDTDAYNEIDDQFAISYMLKLPEKFSVKGICAAPFLNTRSVSPADGMEKSYHEIFKLLELLGKKELGQIVFPGSETYLPDEKTPVVSKAAEFMAELAGKYSPEKPLYIVAIGAITNVASAILLNPQMKENCVIVWLGGHGIHMPLAASEFNMKQDIAAARVVFGCGIPLVQLPCRGVVEHFATSKYELLHWMKGKNTLCDYLCDNTIGYCEGDGPERPWAKTIWDVTAIAWLLNEDGRFMQERLMPSPVPEYDLHYAIDANRHFIRYVYHINREALFADLFRVLGESE